MSAKDKVLLVALLLAGCVSTRSENERHAELGSPEDFLKYLVANSDQKFYTLDAPMPCWVTKTDIPYLMSRLDSTVPSAAVVLSAESNLRLGSTEADEAAFLIQGFRQGRFPPALRSEKTSEQDKVEIRSWWAAGGVPHAFGSGCKGD